MGIFSTALNKIFKSSNQQQLNKIKPIVSKINSLEEQIKKLKDNEFKERTFALRENLKKSNTKVNEILPDAFALVREAANRVLNERPFDVQLMGGIILNEGKIAEMKTGEGKTLVSTLPAYLNALSGEPVHLVTVNEYLAKRDSEWMGKIYNFLGLSVGCISGGISDTDKIKNYKSDIVYGTNSEFGFDYLRDNMKYSLSDQVQRKLGFCIIDEVDSILIDEARTPLIISGRSEDKSVLYKLADKFTKSLTQSDYDLDEKNKNAILTDAGIDKIEKVASQHGFLKNNNFYDPQNLNLVHAINQSLKANYLFKKDVDYIVKESSVHIVDEFTGRVLEGRRFSDGLHQSIEAKENLEIQGENQTLASITYQNYFRLYKKLSGMTGTALTEAEEFFDIYKLEVVSVPTHNNMIRKDSNDEIFRTENEKYNAIVNKIEECNKIGQPILVGTTSIEKSEKISKILDKRKIQHNILNAKHHEKEANIIADAGKLNAITIATNMAGRGTDIKLGGGNANDSEREKIKSLGGLVVIGTERHESRRIDNQLRGRSGRQGDPGSSIFYISLQDELMRLFGAESIDSMLKKLGLKENESVNHPWINKAIERAQQRVEGRNFEIRKTLLKFDDVMNDQRQVVFNQRNKVLSMKNTVDMINEFLDESLNSIKNINQTFSKSGDEGIFLSNVKNICGNIIDDKKIIELSKNSKDALANEIKKINTEKRNARIKLVGEEQNAEVEKRIFLQIIDFSWRAHLQYLDQLRQVIGLRSYGQRDPLMEFKKEAYSLFEGLLNKIKSDAVKFMLNLNLVVSSTKNTENNNTLPNKCLLTLSKGKKISRNDKCEATGKKFKNCCGAL